MLSIRNDSTMRTTGVSAAVVCREARWDPPGPSPDGGHMEIPDREQVRGNAAAAQEAAEEARKIRRLQVMISMVMSVIAQDPNLTVEEASELAANAKRAALAMFPDKELAFDILYRPRLQRLMRERFRLQ